ncbi:MAG TPA: riboflavin synthase [Opitutaceae bacterium]|jgi:riboflavin synthase|nr:riboflavin synthase [Opitutaceae bacterium]
MFTGIVEETGRIEAFAPGAQGWRLEVAARKAAEGAAIGDSIAVNGCCLTVVRAGPDRLAFDVLEETRRLTNFGGLRPGAGVNLERSLAAGGKLGGHFVTGHIDAVGTVERFEPRGHDHYLRVRVPAGGERYLARKGSVALDGVSLTVAEAEGEFVAVWLIPHTLAATALGERKAGDAVNIEFDLLAKYLEKLLPTR